MLPEINSTIIARAINRGLAGRNEVKFYPLFKFLYADGHQMLSLGGMIGRRDHGRKLKMLSKVELPFLRRNLSNRPYEIYVPLVTRKERLYLDSAMPCKTGWKPKEFNFSVKEAREYSKIYRYYPAYTEMLL